MYSSLRPELRGSRRTLRSFQQRAVRPIRRKSVRSFSSFVRLQEQSNPNNNDSKTNDKPTQSNQGISSFLPEPLRNLFTTGNALSEQTPDLSVPHDQSGFSSIKDILEKGRGETQEIDEFLRNGQIPPGFRKVENLSELPTEWRTRFEDKNAIKPPFLFSDNVEKVVRTAPLPENSQGQKAQEFGPLNNDTEKLASSSDGFSRYFENGATSQFYGSSGARRLRARTTKLQGLSQKALPAWFFEYNILTSSERPQQLPPVEIVRRLDNGNYIVVNASEGVGEELQKLPKNEGKAEAEPASEHAFGIGGSSEEPDVPEDSNETKGHSAASTVDSIPLAGQRYYIEEAQYHELLTTVHGRLHLPPESTPRGLTNSMAVNNLTINHASPNADIFLNSLVQDLAKKCDANYASLDIQDISTLIAKADVDPAVAEKGAKLSYRVYEEIYASPTIADSASSPEEEEFDANEEDDGPPGMQSEIPTIHIPMMVGDLSKAMSRLQGGQRNIGGPMNLFSRFLGGDGGSKDPPGIFASIVDSVLFSIAQKKISTEGSNASPENSTDQTIQNNEPSTIIHVQNFKSIQDYNLSGVFLTELCHQVERRVASGQKIMVIGTDCMRDYHIQKNPEEILEEQDRKSFAYSSEIVITPTFPNKDAEMAFIHDRQRRIQMINARHLWNVLQSKGVALKGLQGGFWTKDHISELVDADRLALSKAVWSFNYIQRIAAFVAGSKDKTSDSPVADAIRQITTSDQTKVAWARRNQPDQPKDESKEIDQPEDKRLSKIRAKASRHEKRLLSGVIEPKKISTTFRDIHIPAETVDALQTLTTLSLVRPEAFRYGVLKSDRIPGLLLYGPPGTGKTLAAKAVAKESGATMLEVSAADLNDMYVGEGEKNVQALFSLAKKLSPCVVFLDEADAMFSARAAQGRRVSHRELLNQFLKEWDGMSNDAGSAFIMVATNRPMDLDDAVLRRLPRRLLVDLPTENDRFEILKIHLRQEILADDVDLAKLASRTPFYSGSDLKNVAVAAALSCVREENEAAKKHEGEEPYQHPEKRILRAYHFDTALDEISASISEDMSSLKDIKKFDEQYGDRKGRKRKASRWGFRSPSEPEQLQDTVKVRS